MNSPEPLDGLPKPMFDAYLRGNILFPQMNTPIVIFGGHALSILAMQGYRWQDLMEATPSDEQISRAKDAASRMHKRHSIRCSPDNPPRNKAPDEIHSRFKKLMRGWRRDVQKATTLAVAGLIANSEEIFEPADLFARESHASPFKPEAIAIAALWERATNLLTDPTGQRISLEFREGMAQAKQRLPLQAVDDLRAYLTQGIAEVTPEIEDRSGVCIPPPLAHDFIHSIKR